MNEQTEPSPSGTQETTERPRRPDGTFMSKAELESLQHDVKESHSSLVENNKALMRGTHFTDEFFKGMNPLQVNKFLLNYHNETSKNRESVEAEEPSPNTPIIGTPVGSGNPSYHLDQYLNIDPKSRTIEFEAPASEVLFKTKSTEDAKQKWLALR